MRMRQKNQEHQKNIGKIILVLVAGVMSTYVRVTLASAKSAAH